MENQVGWHGYAPSKEQTEAALAELAAGEEVRGMAVKKATRDAYGETLVELGRVNPNIVVLDADLSASAKTAGFAKAFPERFVQIGIAEQDLIGTAAGLAAAGKIPFASTFAVFATGRAYDQIRNSVAYGNLNVKIAATHAGVTVGEGRRLPIRCWRI